MASIHRDIFIRTSPERAWDALRDIGALHKRLVRGFVTDTRVESGVRIVTFANGMVVRERMVCVDEERRRVVWSAESEDLIHHNGSAQIVAEGAGTRFVWIADLLPDEARPAIESMMEEGIQAVRRTLEDDASIGIAPRPSRCTTDRRDDGPGL